MFCFEQIESFRETRHYSNLYTTQQVRLHGLHPAMRLFENNIHSRGISSLIE